MTLALESGWWRHDSEVRVIQRSGKTAVTHSVLNATTDSGPMF
jgi:hypothetical protein